MKKKKMISIILLSTLVLQTVSPIISVSANSYLTSEAVSSSSLLEIVGTASDITVLNDVVSLTNDYIIINGIPYN